MPTRRERPRADPARAAALALVAALVLLPAAPGLAPCGAAEPSKVGEGEYTLTSRTVWSFYTETPPVMDDPEAAIWDYPLQVIGLVPGHVALSGGTSLDIRSVYTDTDLYMRIIWQDVVENSGAPRWVYHDGNWTFTSPFEDGLGLYFPIGDPLGRFAEEGCLRTCHAQDWQNPENQERKFTYAPNETGDLWYWSAGLTNPWDFALDAYVTDHPSDNIVGYHEDPEMGLGLVKNRHLTEYMQYVYLSRPVYMQDPNVPPSLGPDFILRGEETVFDTNLRNTTSGESGINPITHGPWQNGDIVGGYVLDRLPTEGLGQIAAEASYDVVDQRWSLLLKRPLVTGDAAHDVQFDDLARAYPFAISLFGDIMGGGDASEPFVEPGSGLPAGNGTGSRCVMNKVTNAIGLRFRPVVRAARAEAGAPGSWDGAGWASGSPPMQHELIHWSGEIHDAWDGINVSAAYDGTRLWLHLAYWDPNRTGEAGACVAFLMQSPLSLEESYSLLTWSETYGSLVATSGEADIWNWRWNATDGPPDGATTDGFSRAGRVGVDQDLGQDVAARTWYENGTRHAVLSRALDTLSPLDDIAFSDLARSYACRVAFRTREWGIWLMTFPVTLAFAPDPADHAPPAPVAGVTATDGADSDALVSWDASAEPDFAHYLVFAGGAPFSTVAGMAPVARISSPDIASMHLQGLRPGRTWHVAVVAVDDSRNMDPAVSPVAVAVTDATPPAALSGLGAYDGLDSDLLVRWNSSRARDFDRYEVYFSPSPFPTTEGLAPVATIRGMAVASHRIGGLEVGKAYYVAVVAVDWAGNAVRRVEGVPGTCTDATAPAEVRGIDCSTPQGPLSDGEVLLRWRASSSLDVASYRVYVSLTPIETLVNYEPFKVVPASDTSLLLGGLRPGTTYNFAVTAVDRTGHEGPCKSTVSGRASASAPPPAIVGLAAVQSGDDGARVSWQRANATGLARYQVYVSRAPITALGAANMTLAGNVTPVAEPSLLVTGLEAGATYHFTVVAVDAQGRTSAGGLPVASVTLVAKADEGPSPMDVWGVPIVLAALLVAGCALALVVAGRTRRYGRILSRRPGWERGRNGGGEG